MTISTLHMKLERNSTDLIWEMDSLGVITTVKDFYNNEFKDGFFGDVKTIEALRRNDPISPEDVWNDHYMTIEAHKPFRDFRYFAPTKDGDVACLSVSGVPVTDAVAVAVGNFIGYRGITRNKTIEWKAGLSLNRLARQDFITSLPNRRCFSEALGYVIENKYQVDISLILIDLDVFKNVNDWHGHLMGDKLLQIVASRIRDVIIPGVDDINVDLLMASSQNHVISCFPAR